MTRDELYQYMREPQRLSAETLQPLRELQTAYPYCATFAFLYLYNLSLVQDVRYASELKRLALLLPDRGRLFSLVEGGQTIHRPVEPAEANAFDLIDSYLDRMQAGGAELSSELDYVGVSVGSEDYFASVPEESSIEIGPLELQTLASEDLIPTPAKLPSGGETPLAHKSEEPVEEELFTETLARIYIKQGHYDKALRIIRSISLNYPKKSLYFADQIRFLERLITNNKLR